MKKFYVVGKNSSKSLSPIIFNYWFKRYKINAKYSFLEVNDSKFDSKIIRLLENKQTKGINITIPFKQKIIKHTDVLDIHAKKINAVNCITIGQKIKGHNTDWEGYYKTVFKIKNLKEAKVLLIGYGGAALAIHYVLVTKGIKNIIVFNRSKKKLKFANKNTHTKDLRTLKKYLINSDLIINSTPTNPINSRQAKLINKKTILSDIVYKPKLTKFLKTFPNNKKIYGISMLIEQAIPCFKLWFGFKPSVDEHLLKILDKKII